MQSLINKSANFHWLIQELFPTSDPDIVFVPYVAEDKQSKGHSGALYNEYKVLRKDLRAANILLSSNTRESSTTDDSLETNGNSNLEHDDILCLTDTNRNDYESADIINKCNDTFLDRSLLLSKENRQKKPISLDIYFRTYKCLCPSLGIILLIEDFKKHIPSIRNNTGTTYNFEIDYSNLFCQQWPTVAAKVIAFCRRQKVIEVKNFIQENSSLLQKGTCDNLLALLLIPLSIKSMKVIKCNKDSVALSKFEISKYFILHVENSEFLDIEKTNFESCRSDLQLPHHPYILLLRKLEIAKAFVVLNSELYPYKDPLQAVDACFKCLVALQTYPVPCDFVWAFLSKAVYNLNTVKVTAYVSKFILDISSVKKVQRLLLSNSKLLFY